MLPEQKERKKEREKGVKCSTYLLIGPRTCGQIGGIVLALMTFGAQELFGTGLANRRFPVGGSANGMPRKTLSPSTCPGMD